MAAFPSGSREPAAGWRRLGRWLPWAVGLGLLAWLLYRVPLTELRTAMGRGPALALSLYAAAHLLISFVTDTAATRTGLAVVGIHRPFGEILWVRGATYLLGLVNFTLGQSALAVHLARTRIRWAVAAGATLLQVLVNFVALALLVAVGALFYSPLPRQARWLLVGVIVASVAVTIGVWALRPAWLTRRSVMGPFFDTRLAEHGRALAARLGHFVLFSLLYWGALRVWGIPVPPGEAVVLVTLLMFLAALPITPYGIGTVQVAQVLFFSSYVEAASAAEREASVLAFSLVQYAASLLVQGGLGYGCWLRWQREVPAAAASVAVPDSNAPADG